MNTIKSVFQSKWSIGILMVLCLTLASGQRIAVAEYGFGDIPLDPETYQQFLKIMPDKAADAIPTSYDARDDGIVTSPKDQGSCGSCWAFASVGAFESHLLKAFSFGPTDLSEQQQVSCNLSMAGCCGGSMSAIQFWEDEGPVYESCYPYGESGTSCPTYRTVPCEDSYVCEQLPQRVINYYTVSNNPTQMNTSLYDDGPSYWRFNVYTDFSSGGTGFWNEAGPGDVYVNSASSSLRGGHAVLIIGWDDTKGAYLCKNSWGATGGPNGDGTFWIAYSGHAHDLGFQMANFNLTRECDYCIEDSYGYEWCLDVVNNDTRAVYLQGTCDVATDIKDAMATYLRSTGGLSMTATGGISEVIFNYNANVRNGNGVWMNDQGGNGQVNIWWCTTGDEKIVNNGGPQPDAKD